MKIKFMFATLLMGASILANAQGFQDAIDFYSIDDFENAKIILDKNLGSAANKAEANYYQGMIAFKTGKIAEAKNFFDAGVAADATYPYNYVGQGAVLLKQGNKNAANDAFKAARNITKKNAQVEVAIGEAYFAADKDLYAKEINKTIENARKWTKDAIVETYLFEGDMSFAQENWGDAMGKYEMAFNKNQANIKATVKYADTYYHVNPDLAITKLQEIITSHPNSALVQRHLAEKLYEHGDFQDAASTYGRYINNSANHFPKDEARYAQLLYFADKHSECYEVASKLKNSITAENPYYIPALRMMWYSDANMKKWNEAYAIGKEMFTYKKSEDDINFNYKDLVMYANVCKNAGQAAEAVKYYDAAIKLNPENISLARELASQYAEAKNYESAAHYAKQVLANEKSTQDDKAVLASIYQKQAADTTTTAEMKAMALAEGMKIIDEILEADPANITYLYHKANLMKATEEKNTGAALDPMEKMVNAIKALPAENQPAYNGTLAYAYSYIAIYYFGAKDYAKALDYFKAWQSIDPENTQIASIIGQLEAVVNK